MPFWFGGAQSGASTVTISKLVPQFATMDDALANVTTAGAIKTFSVAAANQGRRLMRILVIQTGGTATSYDAEASTDSLVADAKKRVVQVVGNTTADPCDEDNSGAGYAWNHADDAGKVYVKVTPNVGTTNAYSVRLIFEGSA